MTSVWVWDEDSHRRRMGKKRRKGVFGQWEANRLDIGPLCANFPAWPYQLIKKVSKRRGERQRKRERKRERVR